MHQLHTSEVDTETHPIYYQKLYGNLKLTSMVRLGERPDHV